MATADDELEPEMLIRTIRNAYVDAFAHAIRAQTQRSPRLLVEPRLAESDDDAATADPFRVPMRQDLVPTDGGGEIESVMVVRGSLAEFRSFAVEYEDGFQLGLGPFTWDACQVIAIGLPARPDYTPLLDWFTEWADLRDARPADPATSLRHVVHHVSEPVVREDVTAFEVDFGTADVDALDELLSTLQDMGASIVILGELQQDDVGEDEDDDADDPEIAGPTGAA
jgi:hypothetical protein